jgi:hypothetical protein
MKKYEKNMKKYDILPKVRFIYIGKKKGRQKICFFMFLHISSYFFMFLHVSQYFFICVSCFFMFYLGALVLPILRGPLPVPPGRSPFPSIFFIPAAASGPRSGEVFAAPQGRPRQGEAMALGDTTKEAIKPAGWVVLVPPDWPLDSTGGILLSRQ